MRPVALFFSAALFALGLTGCGGGGGGNSPAALLAITPSNYQDVATDSITGVMGVSDITTLGSTLVGAQVSQSTSLGVKGVALTTATTVLKNWASFNKPTLVGAVTQESLSCTGGGTVSGSLNDADNSDTLTAGDSVSATFTNCVEEGLRINGSLSISVDSFSGDLSTSGSASLKMTFNNLTADGDTINGSLTLSVSRPNSTSATVSLTMPSVTVTFGGDTWSYTAFSMTVSATGSSGTLTMSGNVSSSTYGGSVDVSTPTTITIDSSDRVSGTILIAGKNGTKVRLVGQGTTILIEADTTGNGTYDVNTTVTVASLGL